MNNFQVGDSFIFSCRYLREFSVREQLNYERYFDIKRGNITWVSFYGIYQEVKAYLACACLQLGYVCIFALQSDLAFRRNIKLFFFFLLEKKKKNVFGQKVLCFVFASALCPCLRPYSQDKAQKTCPKSKVLRTADNSTDERNTEPVLSTCRTLARVSGSG